VASGSCGVAGAQQIVWLLAVGADELIKTTIQRAYLRGHFA